MSPAHAAIVAIGRRRRVMPHDSSNRETRVLLSGLGMGESPRWHDGRLWFSHWGIDKS